MLEVNSRPMLLTVDMEAAEAVVCQRRHYLSTVSTSFAGIRFLIQKARMLSQTAAANAKVEQREDAVARSFLLSPSKSTHFRDHPGCGTRGSEIMLWMFWITIPWCIKMMKKRLYTPTGPLTASSFTELPCYQCQSFGTMSR